MLESIKIKDGRLHNLPFHEARMNQARAVLFGESRPIQLSSAISLAENYSLFAKCRIVYDRLIQDITIEPYKTPVINSLKVVEGDEIKYAYKYADREALKDLYEQRGNCDDILIVKNGMITDTYFCNVVLEREGEWFTPNTPLLAGTKRAQLLAEGQIRACPISLKDINSYDSVLLINAMLEPGEIKFSTAAIQYN